MSTGWKPTDKQTTHGWLGAAAAEAGLQRAETSMENDVGTEWGKDAVNTPGKDDISHVESIRRNPLENDSFYLGRRKETTDEEDARIADYALQHPLSTPAEIKKSARSPL